jgi:cysteine desulfurase
MPCYLDNSATTRVCHEAADKALFLMTDCFGNPSSLHTLGIRAEQEMTAARAQVASLFGLPDSSASRTSVTFTSGGTEANNLALFGAAAAKQRQGKHIVTTAIEHPSVLNAAKALEAQGFALTVVKPDSRGNIDARAVADACRPDTVLVSTMLVNNEVGTRLPIETIVPLVRKRAPQALFH